MAASADCDSRDHDFSRHSIRRSGFRWITIGFGFTSIEPGSRNFKDLSHAEASSKHHRTQDSGLNLSVSWPVSCKQSQGPTGQSSVALAVVRGADALTRGARAVCRPYSHCVKLSPYRLESLGRWTAPTASSDESASLAAPGVLRSSRSPCSSNSLFCWIPVSRAREGFSS